MNIMTITDKQKGDIFRLLASKTLYEVGVEFGLDKYYKNVRSMKGKVHNVFNEVKNEPEKFAIQLQTVDLVISAVNDRKITNVPNKPLAEVKGDEEGDIKVLLFSNRDKAAKLVQKKLSYYDKNPKALKEISLPALTTSFAILFDKGRIIQGEATSHVALMGKIDSSLTPEDAMKLVLQMREQDQASKVDPKKQ